MEAPRLTHKSFDHEVAAASFPSFLWKALLGLPGLEEGNFGRQSRLCPPVHLVAGPHQVLSHLQVTRLPFLSSLHSMM